MTDQELEKYVDLGLVEEYEFPLFKEIMHKLDPQTLKERRLALLQFYYQCGDITAEEYEQAKLNNSEA